MIFVVMEKGELKMAKCRCCGIQIPDGQEICSMCYGDINYGTDGYYREWELKQMQLEEMQLEEMQLEEMEKNK